MPSEPHDDEDISGGVLEKLESGKYMPSEPHGEGDIAVELWKKLEPGEK